MVWNATIPPAKPVLIAITSLWICSLFFNFDPALATQNNSLETSFEGAAPDTLRSYNQTVIFIRGNQLTSHLATSSEQKSLGLSVLDNLTEDSAMLFVYRSAGQHGFWMKDMKFSIDIMWIDAELRVAHIEHSLPPCDPSARCPVYSPENDSLYVLETAAGYAREHDINVGDPISIGNSGLIQRVGSQECQGCPIEPSEPYLKSVDGIPLRPASVGTQMMISTAIQHRAEAQNLDEYVTMIEVRDAQGVTQFIAWQKSSLSAEQYKEIEASWMPMDPGKYQFRTFVISDLDSPLIMSTIKSSMWNILA